VYSTLKNIKDKLPENTFLQVHRSYIINLKKIVEIEESTVIIGRDVIPISRSNKSGLIEHLNIIN
jgi:DNA-binding LytR/AlgR family response regulator